MAQDEQVAVPSPAPTEAPPARGTLAEYENDSKQYLEADQPKTADPAPAPSAPTGESEPPPVGDKDQAPKKKTLADRNGDLEKEIQTLNENLRRRKELRAELEALQGKPKQDDKPAPSPAAKTEADGKPVWKEIDGDTFPGTYAELLKAQKVLDAEYLEALADWKADQKFKGYEQKTEAEKRQQTIRERWQPRIESGRKEWDDFDAVALNEDLRPFIQGTVGEFLNESELGEKLLYALGGDLKEAARIARLSPVQQFRELSAMEAEFSKAEKAANGAKPVVTPISKAPKPPTVLRAAGALPDEDDAINAATASGDVGRALALIDARERAERKRQRG